MTWSPPAKWHRKLGRKFRVTVRTRTLLDAPVDLGGVTLNPIAGGLIAVESGGEDALDSLSYALNEYLTQPYEVVDEEVFR